MLATPPSGIRYEVFHDALMCAVTEGQTPSRSCNLGRHARSIIETIADRHPEANPDLIADAYDAFDREAHTAEWRIGDFAPNC
jgi:hypothetical protein